MRNRHKIFIYLRLKTMATEKKQTEKPGSTVSKKNLSNEKKAPKIKLRAKKKWGVKTKTAKKQVPVKIARHKNWNSVTMEDEIVQKYLIGRPRKIKDANELLNQFNKYLASCLEKTRKTKLVPIKTENVIIWNENSENLEEMLENDLDNDLETEMPKKQKGGKTTITNNVIAKFEILEDVERHTVPSIGGFLIFLGGISYKTWDRRRDTDDLWQTVETINNILESILIEETAKGNYNPQIAQFILNVRYNRIPKKEVDNNIKGSVFKESDFIKD